MKKILDTLSALLFVSSFLTVLITAHVSGYEDLLTVMTQENGYFEWMSVILLIVILVYGTIFCWENHRKLSKPMIVLVGGFCFLAFMGAMEEISWGQHLLGFESPDYFVEYNYQQETNLHNLIPAELFGSILYVSIYVFFVFIPLLVILLASHLKLPGRLLPWMATPSMVLIILFGSSFQRFSHDSIDAWLDMAILLCGMVLFGVVAVLKKLPSSLIGFYLIVWMSIALFMYSHEDLGDLFNLVNEIREVFVGLALLYYFIFLTQKLKGPVTDK